MIDVSQTKINPPNQSTWKATSHPFSYRSRRYGFEEDDGAVFQWRRGNNVTIGAGNPARPIRRCVSEEVEAPLMEIQRWNWTHEELFHSLKDFREPDAASFCEKYGQLIQQVRT